MKVFFKNYGWEMDECDLGKGILARKGELKGAYYILSPAVKI